MLRKFNTVIFAVVLGNLVAVVSEIGYLTKAECE